MDPTKPAKEAHFRVPVNLHSSLAFRTLPPSAMKLWVDMRCQLNSYNNGTLDATLATMSKRGWKHPGTLADAIWENLERGLIVRTREGKPGPAQICNLYAFTDVDIVRNDAKFVAGARPTRLYLQWQPGTSFAPPRLNKRIPRKRDTETVLPLIRKPKRSQYENRSVDLEAGTKTVSAKRG